MTNPSQRPLPTQDNTTHKHKTNIHAPSGIRNRDPSNQAAADLRLRPCGHRDQQKKMHDRTYNFNYAYHKLDFKKVKCNLINKSECVSVCVCVCLSVCSRLTL
jgi:hypothetical protein